MRVLSFIPAFVLAAASFVAAAPAAVAAPALAIRGDSCSPSLGGTGDDSSVQPIINIFVNATVEITGVADQLHQCGDSGSPDVDTVSGLVAQITDIVSFTVVQVEAAVKVDLDGLDLTNLCVAISGLLSVVLDVLCTLLSIVAMLAVDVRATLCDVISALLESVISLVGCLGSFVVDAVSDILGPVLALVATVLNAVSLILGLGISLVL